MVAPKPLAAQEAVACGLPDLQSEFRFGNSVSQKLNSEEQGRGCVAQHGMDKNLRLNPWH